MRKEEFEEDRESNIKGKEIKEEKEEKIKD